LKTIGHVDLREGLYRITQQIIPSKPKCEQESNLSANCVGHKSNLWHYRLGHPFDKVLHKICKDCVNVPFNSNETCECCCLGKQQKLKFPLSISRARNLFDIVHMDIWGPINKPFIYDHKYFLTIVGDHNKHTWLYLMKNKSEAKNLMSNFLTFVKN